MQRTSQWPVGELLPESIEDCARCAMGCIRFISHDAGLARQSPGKSVHNAVRIPIPMALETTHGLRIPQGGRNHLGVTPVIVPIASLHRCICSLICAGVLQKRFTCVAVWFP